jgi:hypothetical protein
MAARPVSPIYGQMEANSPSSGRPTIRHCPVCGIAMQASKSRGELAEFDLFKCLTCETTISRPSPAGDGGGRR